MEKDLSLSLLLDVYGALLTPPQRECMDLYYNEDFSLTEIADHQKLSRQGVRDRIKRGEASLRHFEETLHLVAHAAKREQALARLGQLTQSLQRSDPLDPALLEIIHIITDLRTDLPT